MPKKGCKLSEENKKKLSILKTGRKLSEDTKNKIRLANIGKHPSEETRKKLSDARMDGMKPKHNRSREERYIELINYIIDHPNSNTSQIQQTVNLEAEYLNAILLSMRNDRLIIIKHIKTLRKGARLISITRKGIEEIYERKKQ